MNAAQMLTHAQFPLKVAFEEIMIKDLGVRHEARVGF